jgi:cytochrome c peroxidase
MTIPRVLALVFCTLLAACEPAALTSDELEKAKGLSLLSLGKPPANPSNRHADSGQAAALGEKLFFDTGFSSNGAVACVTCHLPDRQFQDDLERAHGVGITDRRAMPLLGAAWSPFLFWDGRADSLWAQALGPLESNVEHGATRTFHARRLVEKYAVQYAALFGPAPDTASWPQHAGPFGSPQEIAAWQALTAETREAINTVFANLGKALEAYQRSLELPQTRFDQYVMALAEARKPDPQSNLTPQEIEGFRLFTGKAECTNCHNGPRLTDDHFHNTGVPQAKNLPADFGRAAAIAKLDADPFNCLGPYSDAKPEECGELKFMSRDEHELERAFKPPSLRGAASRPPFMHSGQITSIEAVIEHYNAAPPALAGHSELRPLNLEETEKQALVAFLRTLDPL